MYVWRIFLCMKFAGNKIIPYVCVNNMKKYADFILLPGFKVLFLF